MSILQTLLSNITNLLRWWFTVAPWERAVRVRLGRWVSLQGPGPHWCIPWVDRVYLQTIRRRFVLLSMQTLTTLDGEVVTIRGSLGYSIVDLLKLHQTLHDAEDTINLETQGRISNFIVRSTLKECTAAALTDAVRDSLDLGRYGLGDVEFHVVDLVSRVRTFRLIQDQGRQWKHGSPLSTTESLGGK